MIDEKRLTQIEMLMHLQTFEPWQDEVKANEISKAINELCTALRQALQNNALLQAQVAAMREALEDLIPDAEQYIMLDEQLAKCRCALMDAFTALKEE